MQTSFHEPGTACAQCIHPEAAEVPPAFPTGAFVSFWAGLLTTVMLLRWRAGAPAGLHEQQLFFAALRPESWDFAASSVRKVDGCPSCEALASASGPGALAPCG